MLIQKVNLITELLVTRFLQYQKDKGYFTHLETISSDSDDVQIAVRFTDTSAQDEYTLFVSYDDEAKRLDIVNNQNESIFAHGDYSLSDRLFIQYGVDREKAELVASYPWFYEIQLSDEDLVKLINSDDISKTLVYILRGINVNDEIRI